MDRERVIRASVIVCTRDRRDRLGACLAALAAQDDLPEGGFEVLIVDNGSQDDTAAVVAGFVAAAPDRFRYLSAPLPGKSRALNHALARAAGEYLLFTDDDCIAAPDWVRCAIAELDEDPAIGVLGGRIELHDPRDMAVTIRTGRERVELASTAQLFFFVAGCNMVIRRRVVDRVGPFDVLLGPGSQRGAGAEDVDYVYRAFRCGERVVYSPRPCVRHAHGRRSYDQLAALERSYVEGRGAFYAKHIVGGDAAILRMAYWELRGCVARAVQRPLAAARLRDEWRLIRQLLRGAWQRLVDVLCRRHGNARQLR
ncbi:MAG: glycosyltransferase [Gammaproteobacteria bacterium]